MDVNLLRNRRKFDKYELILNLCGDKNVLDIGCAGQDLNYEHPSWLHGRIGKIAKSITGVDIDKESVNKLRSSGYNILLPEEMNEVKNRFDIIVMADVIEHVEDPVGLLKKYASYLEEEGLMLVSTPNAKRANDFLNILWGNNFWLNEEHTMWLCPYTISEVVRRAGLRITGFYWLKNYKIAGQKTGFKASVINFFSNILSFIRPMFSANFLIKIQK
jgi:2-polyprenyl-3-methyl-5-hydroxy-6-metoxy-1,4-benzoquinol methylase